ncbi:MAG TPA: MBL fold metallo-hydrolase [Pirellulales bacterium]|nr:MBL fold metallo-hydrolase [Pirellulales bacterium]
MHSDKFQLATVVSRPFDENTYIAWLKGRHDCLIVDPGFEPDSVFDVIGQNGLTPAAILNTHGHADHISGNEAMKQRWPDCPLAIGHGDAPKLTDAALNLSARYCLPLTSPPADIELREGKQFEAAGFVLDVYEIPGHSIGHVVLVWKASKPMYVFGGDVLFAGSVGRTDFPDGSFAELAGGIHRKLFTQPDDAVVLSGHGPPTTIGQEKETNPFVGRPAGWQPG